MAFNPPVTNLDELAKRIEEVERRVGRVQITLSKFTGPFGPVFIAARTDDGYFTWQEQVVNNGLVDDFDDGRYCDDDSDPAAYIDLDEDEAVMLEVPDYDSTTGQYVHRYVPIYPLDLWVGDFTGPSHTATWVKGVQTIDFGPSYDPPVTGDVEFVVADQGNGEVLVTGTVWTLSAGSKNGSADFTDQTPVLKIRMDDTASVTWTHAWDQDTGVITFSAAVSASGGTPVVETRWWDVTQASVTKRYISATDYRGREVSVGFSGLYNSTVAAANGAQWYTDGSGGWSVRFHIGKTYAGADINLYSWVISVGVGINFNGTLYLEGTTGKLYITVDTLDGPLESQLKMTATRYGPANAAADEAI